jgi:hypothetical protein
LNQEKDKSVTVNFKIGMVSSNVTVCIYTQVRVFVNRKIIVWALSDDTEVVDECFVMLAILQRAFDLVLRYTHRLVLVASGKPCAGNTLWLEMRLAANIVAIDV